MNIAIVGAGFVGLTHAAVCAEWGHRVIAYDIDSTRIAAFASGHGTAIERYVNEPGLAACVRAHLGENLCFTASSEFMSSAGADRPELIFLCLPTPTGADGSTDRRHYIAAAREVATRLARRGSVERVVVVSKSTVPIGTTRMLHSILIERGARFVGVAANPEFLPQGCALSAARAPDRVVVGADSEDDLALVRSAYEPLLERTRAYYLETTPETAEAIKYVGNALLFTYISFWNGIGARLAEGSPRVRMDDLRRGVLGDRRISDWGAQVSNGAGGSCFGKDLRSLVQQMESWPRQPGNHLPESCRYSVDLLRAVHSINEYQKTYLLERACRETGVRFNNKTVAVLGLAFKCNTNDMRESSALRVVEDLLARGARAIRAHDPVVDAHTARRWLDPDTNHLFERISYHRSAAEALRGSDLLFISTDWAEYHNLAGTIREVVSPPYLIIDGRRMIRDAQRLVGLGYSYLTVGAVSEQPLEHSNDDSEPEPAITGRGRTRAA